VITWASLGWMKSSRDCRLGWRNSCSRVSRWRCGSIADGVADARHSFFSPLSVSFWSNASLTRK
jgi:hypothetical protein